MAKTKKIPFNIAGPLSVSIVVITLGAAFGVLSGRGAFIGMASTSIITLVTALFSGSRYGISSPTGPMTAAIAVILLLDQRWLQTHHANLDLDGLVNLTLIFAGAILLFFTLIKIHRLVRLVPNLVVSGFVNGIALLIIFAQFSALTTTQDIVLMLITFFFALSISFAAKHARHLWVRIVSSSLFIIIFMSFIAAIIGHPFTYVDLAANATNLSFVRIPFEAITPETLMIILPLAFELALIALLDTILTAVIIDTKTRQNTHMTRELAGQSFSMLGVSLIGGIPGAQSTVPSMMMVQEKGGHRFAKLALAFFCILFTFLFAEFLQFVPLAVFGGIILKIAVDVADFSSLKNLFSCTYNQKVLRMFILVGTCLSTVLISLNLAVVAFTLFFVLWNSIFPKQLRLADLKTGSESEGFVDEL